MYITWYGCVQTLCVRSQMPSRHALKSDGLVALRSMIGHAGMSYGANDGVMVMRNPTVQARRRPTSTRFGCLSYATALPRIRLDLHRDDIVDASVSDIMHFFMKRAILKRRSGVRPTAERFCEQRSGICTRSPSRSQQLWPHISSQPS